MDAKPTVKLNIDPASLAVILEDVVTKGHQLVITDGVNSVLAELYPTSKPGQVQ